MLFGFELNVSSKSGESRTVGVNPVSWKFLFCITQLLISHSHCELKNWEEDHIL